MVKAYESDKSKPNPYKGLQAGELITWSQIKSILIPGRRKYNRYQTGHGSRRIGVGETGQAKTERH